MLVFRGVIYINVSLFPIAILVLPESTVYPYSFTWVLKTRFVDTGTFFIHHFVVLGGKQRLVSFTKGRLLNNLKDETMQICFTVECFALEIGLFGLAI